MVEKDGGPVETRTLDLYRVKVPRSITYRPPSMKTRDLRARDLDSVWTLGGEHVAIWTPAGLHHQPAKLVVGLLFARAVASRARCFSWSEKEIILLTRRCPCGWPWRERRLRRSLAQPERTPRPRKTSRPRVPSAIYPAVPRPAGGHHFGPRNVTVL